MKQLCFCYHVPSSYNIPWVCSVVKSLLSGTVHAVSTYILHCGWRCLIQPSDQEDICSSKYLRCLLYIYQPIYSRSSDVTAFSLLLLSEKALEWKAARDRGAKRVLSMIPKSIPCPRKSKRQLLIYNLICEGHIYHMPSDTSFPRLLTDF